MSDKVESSIHRKEWDNDVPEVIKNDFRDFDNLCFDNAYAIIENKNYEKAAISIAGFSFEIKTYLVDGREHMRQVGRNTGDALTFLSQDNSYIELYLSGTKIKLSTEDAKSLLDYRNSLKNTDIEEFTKTAIIIAKHMIFDDSELIRNFILQVPYSIYFQPILLIQFEARLLSLISSIEPLLMSNRIQHLAYTKAEARFDEIGMHITTTFEHGAIILDYYENHFLRLVEYFKNNLNIDNDIACASTHYAINRLFPKIYSNIFVEKYLDSPPENELTQGNYVKWYYNLDLLEHDNIETLGGYICYLMTKHNVFTSSNYVNNIIDAISALSAYVEKTKQNAFIARLSKTETELNEQTKVTIDDLDMMSGIEFEVFITQLFKKMGYCANQTKASGDQGIDVIVEKSGKKYGIQAKCYSNIVSNSAIQEAVAGKEFYKLDNVMVITNRFFTSSAVELARANSVVLWDRDMLKEKLLIFNE